MASLPTGTVTFLFTDIESSTKISQEYPDQWEALRERHHALINRSMQAHNGYVFLTVGDAFYVAFHTAVEALNAAVAAQRLLQHGAWHPAPVKVRMGINTGAAQASRGDDRSSGYEGYSTLARVQRVMSVAHGEQVLLSNSTYELVRGELPEGLNLLDLKEHRLKGFLNLEHLWQVAAPDLRADFPPLQSLNSVPNNLPSQLTNFIGREKEIVQIKKELELHRLVTLTGPGGTGKTRLTLQVGADVLDSYKNGVWFVELAPLSDARLVPQSVASVLGVKEEPGGTILEALANYVKDKDLLIILDNCEHLVQASAELAKLLTQSGSGVKLLASSREHLHLAGEQTYPVPSLSVPDPQKRITIEALTQFEAVRLFIDRVVTAQPAFQVTNQNAPAVAEICHRLDGIPLAIELAAARVRALSVEKIAERLSNRFSLLTGGDKTALPRQQTLRALIDWSYDLLSEPERALFRRLAVFAGGWTLEAAEAVGAGSQVHKLDVLDLLSNLVEKSLVKHDSQAERFGMLESLRQYGREKLELSIESQTYLQNHGEYFLKLAEEAEPQLTGTEQAKWLDRLEVEHDNLRAALEWTLGAAEAETAHRLGGALGRFWWVHGHMTEGRRWLKQALAVREGVAKGAQAKALRWAGGLAWPQGDLETARNAFDESLALYRQLGDKQGIAIILGNLGTVAQNQGDYSAARELFEQSLEILRELGNKWGMANALNNLGNVAQEQRDYAGARLLQEESLAIRRELGDKRGMGIALNNLGSVALEQADVETARAYFEESMAINHAMGDKMMLAYNFSGLAQVLDREGQEVLAAQLEGATGALLEEMGAPLEPYEQSQYDHTTTALEASLGKERYQQAFEAGRALSLEQAVELAQKKNE